MTTTNLPARHRILVVDDDDLVRATFARVLRKRFDVVVVSDGAEAVAIVEAGERFDVILMDVEMPTMGGKEAFERIAASRPELAARVIVVSGGSDDHGVSAWLDGLAPGRRLSKPVNGAALFAAISALFDP